MYVLPDDNICKVKTCSRCEVLIIKLHVNIVRLGGYNEILRIVLFRNISVLEHRSYCNSKYTFAGTSNYTSMYVFVCAPIKLNWFTNLVKIFVPLTRHSTFILSISLHRQSMSPGTNKCAMLYAKVEVRGTWSKGGKKQLTIAKTSQHKNIHMCQWHQKLYEYDACINVFIPAGSFLCAERDLNTAFATWSASFIVRTRNVI
jgi:hypothetical protein